MKNNVVSLLWCGCCCGRDFDPWPGDFCMLRVWAKKKKKKKKRIQEENVLSTLLPIKTNKQIKITRQHL